MTNITRKSPIGDTKCSISNAALTTTATGPATTFGSPIRPNAVVRRDLPLNTKNSKPVAVNADEGHCLNSTLAKAMAGD